MNGPANRGTSPGSTRTHSRSYRRHAVWHCLLLVAVAACGRGRVEPTSAQTPVARIPRNAPRFEIDSVTDSTAIFRVQEAQWLRTGMSGYAIDPRQRDALVARVKVVAADSAYATVQVTSQVSLVKRDHVLLIVEPLRPWWRKGLFWTGAGLGALLGAGTAIVAR
ncbi:MAG TPA: hypothetical protein VGE27_11380 [Gemmatimonas sp.]|uniref:hypothetical protein n=1 Tax=Gemmatimonas sp. TaxID=1962908 RepID=UPI002EDA818E